MAIIDKHPGSTPTPTPKPIDIHTENRTAVVDTDVERLSNILTHVEGMSWYVNYYQQILGDDDQTATQETSLTPVTQQYRRIEEFEFKVQSPLSVSTNSETYAQTLTGDAIIYPGTLIPNKGDMFVSDIGAGESGVFTITEVDLMSHYKDRCYRVSYRLVRRLVGAADTYLIDLDHKVVRTYMYQKDYLVYGRDPVITTDEATVNRRLHEQTEVLLNYYFSVYYSEDHATMLFPDNASVTYDPAIPKVLMALLNTHDHPLMRKVRSINTEAIKDTQQRTIWDVLLRRTPQLLSVIPRAAMLVPACQFANNPQLYNVAYSGLEYVVVPERMYSVSPYRKAPYLHEYIPKLEVRYKDLGKQVTTPDSASAGTLPDTPVVRSLSTYVVSAGVYDRGEVTSALESCVQSYLNESGMDREELFRLSEKAVRWPYLEGYYYIPLLLILMLSALRGA